ncbi:Membrane-bound transcription factor site-2 protease homolog [Linum grandiflorum]
MERTRRIRTFGGRRRNHSSLLPLRSDTSRIPSLSSTISCCYCDYKFSALNAFLFRFGSKYSHRLRVWFSIGVGFSLAALAGATLLLVWELTSSSKLVDNLAGSFLFGVSPQVYGLSLSIGDAAHLFFATLVSVSVHEFGHAIAAASFPLVVFLVVGEQSTHSWLFLLMGETSEGIQVEYIAVFIAGLFPGALVAFDYEKLHALERINALRVYCAGIWHNAAVLNVPSASLLSGYLSPGDLIVSLDGKHVHDEHEWKELTTLLQDRSFQHSNLFNYNNSQESARLEKGYCVPTSVMEDNRTIHLGDLQYACPDGFAEFRATECPELNKLDEGFVQAEGLERRLKRYCLTDKDIVSLKKCGGGWLGDIGEESSCSCSESESCLSPVQQPGLVWAEITYSRPYCLQLETESSSDSETVDLTPHKCGGTFVFIGDLVSMAHSVQLTSYQPRYRFPFSAYLPKVMEKAAICIFYVSLTLALLNSLPVFYLDGESILELALSYFTWLRPSKRPKALRACLICGTIISLVAFLKILIFTIFNGKVLPADNEDRVNPFTNELEWESFPLISLLHILRQNLSNILVPNNIFKLPR